MHTHLPCPFPEQAVVLGSQGRAGWVEDQGLWWMPRQQAPTRGRSYHTRLHSIPGLQLLQNCDSLSEPERGAGTLLIPSSSLLPTSSCPDPPSLGLALGEMEPGKP